MILNEINRFYSQISRAVEHCIILHSYFPIAFTGGNPKPIFVVMPCGYPFSQLSTILCDRLFNIFPHLYIFLATIGSPLLIFFRETNLFAILNRISIVVVFIQNGCCRDIKNNSSYTNSNRSNYRLSVLWSNFIGHALTACGFVVEHIFRIF